MTENATPAPAAAVRIVVTSMTAWPLDTSDEDDARAVVAALARAGWLHDPVRVAALEAVAVAAGTLADEPDRSRFERHLADLEERIAVLDKTGIAS
jgi:hypothetical protein